MPHGTPARNPLIYVRRNCTGGRGDAGVAFAGRNLSEPLCAATFVLALFTQPRTTVHLSAMYTIRSGVYLEDEPIC